MIFPMILGGVVLIISLFVEVLGLTDAAFIMYDFIILWLWEKTILSSSFKQRTIENIAAFPKFQIMIYWTNVVLQNPLQNPELSLIIRLIKMYFFKVYARHPGCLHDLFILMQSAYLPYFRDSTARRKGSPCPACLVTPACALATANIHQYGLGTEYHWDHRNMI